MKKKTARERAEHEWFVERPRRLAQAYLDSERAYWQGVLAHMDMPFPEPQK